MWWLDQYGVLEDVAGSQTRRPSRSNRPCSWWPRRSGQSRPRRAARHGRAAHRARRRHRGRHGVLTDDLADAVAIAQARLERMLGRLDRFADRRPRQPRPGRPACIRCPADAARPRRRGHSRRSFGRPVSDATTVGCTYRCSMRRAKSSRPAGSRRRPGCTSLGLRFQRRKNSNFIDGVGADAVELAADIQLHLRAMTPLAA